MWEFQNILHSRTARWMLPDANKDKVELKTFNLSVEEPVGNIQLSRISGQFQFSLLPKYFASLNVDFSWSLIFFSHAHVHIEIVLENAVWLHTGCLNTRTLWNMIRVLRTNVSLNQPLKQLQSIFCWQTLKEWKVLSCVHTLLEVIFLVVLVARVWPPGSLSYIRKHNPTISARSLSDTDVSDFGTISAPIGFRNISSVETSSNISTQASDASHHSRHLRRPSLHWFCMYFITRCVFNVHHYTVHL